MLYLLIRYFIGAIAFLRSAATLPASREVAISHLLIAIVRLRR